MNKMRIGEDGKKNERTEENWSKMEKANDAIWRESLWCRKIGEDGVSSFACRMTQGIFVVHHDRTGAVLCITKN